MSISGNAIKRYFKHAPKPRITYINCVRHGEQEAVGDIFCPKCLKRIDVSQIKEQTQIVNYE